MNDLNEIKTEGGSDWFKQPFIERLYKRTDNTDILKNKNLNEIIKK